MRRAWLNPFLWLLLTVFAGIALGTFMSRNTTPPTTPSSSPAPMTEAASAPIVMDEQGIVFFPYAGEEYRRALSAFYAQNGNRDLHCDYQGAVEQTRVWHPPYAGPARTNAYTAIIGHILHCHDMAVDADRVTLE